MPKLKNKLILSSCLFIFFVLNNQCSITKHVGGKAKPVNSKIEAYNRATVLNLNSKLSIKYTAKFSSNIKSNNLSGYIQLVSDTSIMLNVVSRTLGVEILRMKCYPDSIYFIDKMNKKYYKGDYSYLKKYLNFNVSFQLIKSFVTAKVSGVCMDYTSQHFDLFSSVIEDNKYNFYLNNDLKNKNCELIKHNFTINGLGLVTYNAINDTKNKRKLEFNYSYLKNSFPESYTMHLIDNTNDFNIFIKYINISEDVSDFRFRIPSNYTLIE